MTEIHNTPPNGRGHEESDANVSALAKYGIGLTVIFALVLVLMLMLRGFFATQTRRATPPASPLAAQRQAPPAPLLQVTPEKDLLQVRATEDSILHTYGKVTSDASVVRLPIERAMELVAQRGLPARESKAEDRRSRIEDGGLKQ